MNLEDWQGVGILYARPWNKNENMVCAKDWQEVDLLVRITIALLNDGWTHENIQIALYEAQQQKRI